jgi:alanine-glyoxylate transaminase/serine-glyoxylate transaminase/serine-pyruvate transaminase
LAQNAAKGRKMPAIVNLYHGRPYLAIPGPSVVPDRVQRAMHRAAPNIYEGELHSLTASLWPDLRAVAGTVHNVACYIGNGHALWEAVNTNLFSRGDKVLVLASGAFGLGWANVASAMAVDVEIMDFGRQLVTVKLSGQLSSRS